MTFGCGLKISQKVAKQGLDSLVLNPMQSVGNSENPALPSKINFYVSFCRLHHIIGDILETFYISTDDTIESCPNKALTRMGLASSFSLDKFASLFRLELDLKKWAGSLHPFFQSPSDAADPTPTKRITREANVLRARSVWQSLLIGTLLTSAAGIYTFDFSCSDHSSFKSNKIPRTLLRTPLFIEMSSCYPMLSRNAKFIASKPLPTLSSSL